MAPSTSTRKAQVWSLDLFIAVLIFLGGLLLFYKYSINLVDSQEQGASDLAVEAKIISSYLTSAGYPQDWASGTVASIGLTDGEARLSKSKVEEFYDLALSNYTITRRLLSTQYDYLVEFKNKDNNPVSIGTVQKIGKDYTTYNPENIIKITRFVFYNSSIIKMEVYAW
jgi:hypothetical protein